jgi:hypothetical protein
MFKIDGYAYFDWLRYFDFSKCILLLDIFSIVESYFEVPLAETLVFPALEG